MRGIALALSACLMLGGGSTAVAASQPEATDAATGAAIYRDLCSACHGRYGRGDGPLARSLAVRPPDFTDSRVLAGRTDKQVVAGLTRGAHASRMAIGATLKKDALLESVAYIRALSVPGKRVSVLAGEDLYQTSCWICHGRNGDGKGDAAKNLQGAQPRDFTSDEFVLEGREEEIFRSIVLGAAEAIHGSEYMPAWGMHLSAQEIRDVIEYLKTFKK